MSEPQKFSLHFWDNARPDDEGVFPVYVYTDVVPRVGDHVYYNKENTPPQSYEDGEPEVLQGRVAKVEINYRMFQRETVALVSVWLDDYKTRMPKKRERKGRR